MPVFQILDDEAAIINVSTEDMGDFVEQGE